MPTRINPLRRSGGLRQPSNGPGATHTENSASSAGGGGATIRLRSSANLRRSGGLRSSRMSRSGRGGPGGTSRRRARASLRFSRLRVPKDDSIRDLVESSWDDEPGDPSSAAISDFNGQVPICSVAASAVTFGAAAGVHAPQLRQTALGKRWSVDIVSVVHNAVRTEMADLFDILTSIILNANVRRATPAELRAFFAWFSSFEAFVVTALKAEEEVLYPWLEQWGRIDGALSTGARIAAKGAIIRQIRDASACSALLGLHHLPAGGVLSSSASAAGSYYDGLSVGFANPSEHLMNGALRGADGDRPEMADASLCKRVLDAVVEHVVAFSNGIALYFREQEDALPKIIESLYDLEDVRSSGVDRRMVRAIWKSGRRDEATMMLVRGLGEDRLMARAWTQRNLRHIDRLSLPLWRRRYVAGRGAVVERFRMRKRKHEQLLALQGRALITYQPITAAAAVKEKEMKNEIHHKSRSDHYTVRRTISRA